MRGSPAPWLRFGGAGLLVLTLGGMAPACGKSRRETSVTARGGAAGVGGGGAPAAGGKGTVIAAGAPATAGATALGKAGETSSSGGVTGAAGAAAEAGEGGASSGTAGMDGQATGGGGDGGHATSGAGSGGVTSAGAGSSGGLSGAGGNAGSGCTGTYEVRSTGESGLCVAKMADILGPAEGSSYRIDATEVTRGQYDAWLATSPALPPSTDALCGVKADGSYAETDDGFTGEDADHHPVVGVDFCDARAYCAGVGKRLCGAIGGGSNDYDSFRDETQSQWYRACTSGGRHTYPYGDSSQVGSCNDGGRTPAGTTVVGSLPECVTSTVGYAGVYDLAGNVAEWEDSCSSGTCRVRGGAYTWYLDDINDTSCRGGNADYANHAGVSQTAPTLGFRCCSR